jgi:N-acetylmuramoyl-L-alanine amidase
MRPAYRFCALRLLAAGVVAQAVSACAAQIPSTSTTRADATPPVSVSVAAPESRSGSVLRRSAAPAVTPGQLAAAAPTTTTFAAATSAPDAAVPSSSGSRRAPTRGLPLAGKTVGIDPGHNGGNFNDPSYIDRLVWNGREMETCNTTGTATDSGYTEAQFNFNVATFLAADLRAQGTRVVLTRHTNTGVGPCVNVRAHIIDSSGAQVAIDIHADGGPPTGRGVAILEPVADGINNRIIGASERFGQELLHQMETVAGMPPSTYDGTGGIVFRDDLAGLNLTTVPEVLIESGNMRNATDAALLITPGFQRLEAHALDLAIVQFLAGAP